MAADRPVFDNTTCSAAYGSVDREEKRSRSLDPEELELIAAAVAAGRVTKCKRGESGLGERHPWFRFLKAPRPPFADAAD